MKSMLKRAAVVGGGVGSLVALSSANAAMDVAGAITTFSDVETAIPIVGAAFLGVLGLLAAWKLIRGAFA